MNYFRNQFISIDHISFPDDRVKEIPLIDNSIPNPNRHNISLIPKHGNGSFKGPVIPVIVFACNRVSVKNCLENLVDYRPNADQFPIIVSQVSDSIDSIQIFVNRNDSDIPYRIVTTSRPGMSYCRSRRYF